MSDDHATSTRSVSTSYTFNKEETGEELLHQMRHARGTNLIAPLLAHSHAFRRLEYDRPRHKHVKPAQSEPFNLTLLYSDWMRAPAPDPFPKAPVVPAMSAVEHGGMHSSARENKLQDPSEQKFAATVPRNTSPTTPKASRAILIPITPATTVGKAPSTIDQHKSPRSVARSAKQGTTDADKKPARPTKKNVKHLKPLEEKPMSIVFKAGTSDIPQSILDLVAEIEALKRNSSDLPIRAPLRGEDKFRAHFDRSAGRLRSESALMEWYGDTRLFSQTWWEYLVAETPARKGSRSGGSAV